MESDGGKSFICCGIGDKKSRTVKQDCYRHCWKNKSVDERTDWDERDIIDTVFVLMQALSICKNKEE